VDFKYGFVVSQQPAEYYMQFSRNNGLSHMEIDLHKDHSLLPSFDTRRIENLKKLAATYGVSFSVHPPYTLNLAEKNKALAQEQMDLLKQSIELARKLNAKFMTTYIGSVDNQKGLAAARSAALKRAIKALEQALESCQKCSLKLAIENTNLMPKDSENFFLGDNLKDLAAVFKEIDSPLLNLCLDLGHAHVNEGIAKYIDKFADKIISVHFHDNKGETDDHLDVGDGNINWKAVMKAFAKIKYCGPFLSETIDSPAQSKRKLLEYL